MLITQSKGSEVDTPGRAVSTVRYEIHHQQLFARIKLLFMYMYMLLRWKQRAVRRLDSFVHCLPEGLGLRAAASVGPLATTHVVKYVKSLYQYIDITAQFGVPLVWISLLYCTAVVSSCSNLVCIPLVKLRLEMIHFMQPDGVMTLGGPSLSSRFLTCICLAFYEALFTFLLSVCLRAFYFGINNA